MPNRPATWVSAIFAGVLAAMLPATLSYGATPAAKDCPSGPKVPASRGGHWYYHIDHATGRHCWYLGQAHDKVSQPAAAFTRGRPASPEAEAALQPSIADAHAELQGPPASSGPNPGDALTPVILASAAVGGDGGAPKTPGAEMLRSLVALRCPDSLGVSSSAGEGPALAKPVAAAATSANSTAAAPVVAAVSNGAADAASETPPVSVRMLTIAMAGAVSLAGLIAIAFVRTRGSGRSETPGDRRTIRISAGAEERQPPAPSDADDRIAEMLALLSDSGRP